MIVDGAIRDTVSVSNGDVAVWSAARTPRAALGRYITESIATPVQLAGNTVHPGDIVVADDDGIAVVPSSLLDEVAARCTQADVTERRMLALIDSCATINELTAALNELGQLMTDQNETNTPSVNGCTDEPAGSWTPDPTTVEQANLTRFLHWLADTGRGEFTDYHQLWAESVRDTAWFWDAVWHYFRHPGRDDR